MPRDPRLGERPFEQAAEIQGRSPAGEGFEIETFPLDLQNAEDGAPLPIRNAAPPPVPVELAQDQVLRARHEDPLTRLLELWRKPAPIELRSIEGSVTEHEEVHLQDCGLVDGIEGRAPADRVARDRNYVSGGERSMPGCTIRNAARLG